MQLACEQSLYVAYLEPDQSRNRKVALRVHIARQRPQRDQRRHDQHKTQQHVEHLSRQVVVAGSGLQEHLAGEETGPGRVLRVDASRAEANEGGRDGAAAP